MHSMSYSGMHCHHAPDNVTVYGRINVTMGQITGLRPFIQYVVMVSGENGVSAQDTDTSGRTVRAIITTEEGGEFLIQELRC